MQTDRGKLRMERLRQLELEQLEWEQEALVMPEDLNRALFLSFESVKTEFSDLDGLSWSRYPVPLVTNPWAIDEPTPKVPCAEIGDDMRTPIHSPTFSSHQSPPRRPPSKPLSRADVTHFPQETIRVPRHTHPSRSPLQPANQFFSTASRKDPLISLSHPPANIALACRLRHPAC